MWSVAGGCMGRAQNVYFPFFVRRRWEKDTQIIPYLKISNLFLDQQRDKEKKYLVFYNRKNLEKIKQIKSNRYIPFVEPTNDYLPQTTFVIDFDINQDLPEVNEKIVRGFNKLYEALNGKCLLVRSSSGTGWHVIFVTNGNIEPKNYQQLQKDIIKNVFQDVEDYIDYNASLSKRQGFYHLAYFPEWIENGYINLTKKDQGKNRNFWTKKITLDPFEIHALQDTIVPFNKRDVYRLNDDIAKTVEFIEKARRLNAKSIENQYLVRFINIIGEISASQSFQLKSLLTKFSFNNLKKDNPLAASVIEQNILNIAEYTGYYRAINGYLNINAELEETNSVFDFLAAVHEININKRVNDFFNSEEKNKIIFFDHEISSLNNLFVKNFDVSLINNPDKCFLMIDSFVKEALDKEDVARLKSIKRFIKFVFEFKSQKTDNTESKFVFQSNENFVNTFLETAFNQNFDSLSISKQNQQTLKKIWREEQEWLKTGFNNLLSYIFQLKIAQNNIFIDIGLEDFKKHWNTHERRATALRQLLMPSLSKGVNEYKPHWKRRGFMIDWLFFDNFLSKNFMFTPKYLANKMGNGNTWSVIRMYAKPLVANYGLYEACKIFNEAIWLSQAKHKKQRIREFALFARKISKQLQEQKCKLQAQTAV